MSRLSPGRIGFLILVVLMFIYLLAPVIMVIPMSFSGANSLVWPPPSWSTRWYAAILQDAEMAAALRNSLVLASIVTALSLTIGGAAAYALNRGRYPGREAMSALLTAPLLLPSIVLGLALLIIFVQLRLIGQWPGLVLAHLLITLPYAIRVLGTALATLPPAVEDAAASLGAPPGTVFRRITLPLMARGVVAAGAISFLVSFDEVVITLFVVGPQLNTLPVALYHYVERRTDPQVAAISVLLILFTLVLVLVMERAIGLRRTIGGRG
ncbi:ABC transporter permease [Muricoccus radiodurans]|uniref:ABC transporter permease n=1 Tax=Muricoccus radiodurans TaxID=2231721 RepID=UPI003CF00AA3